MKLSIIRVSFLVYFAIFFYLSLLFATSQIKAIELDALGAAVYQFDKANESIRTINNSDDLSRCLAIEKNYGTDEEFKIQANCLKKSYQLTKWKYPQFFPALQYGENNDFSLFPPDSLFLRQESLVNQSNSIDVFSALKSKRYELVYIYLQNGGSEQALDSSGMSVIEYLIQDIENADAQDLLKLLAGEFVSDPTLQHSNSEAGNYYLKVVNQCFGTRYRHLNLHNRLMSRSLVGEDEKIQDHVLQIIRSDHRELSTLYSQQVDKRYREQHRNFVASRDQAYHQDLMQKKVRYESLKRELEIKYTPENLSDAANTIVSLKQKGDLSFVEKEELQKAILFLDNYSKTKMALMQALDDYSNLSLDYGRFVTKAALRSAELDENVHGRSSESIKAADVQAKFDQIYDNTNLLSSTPPSLVSEVVLQHWEQANSATENQEKVDQIFRDFYLKLRTDQQQGFDLLDLSTNKNHVTSSHQARLALNQINSLQEELNNSNYLGRVKRAMLIVSEIENHNVPLSFNRFLQDEYDAAKRLLSDYSNREFDLNHKIKKSRVENDKLRDDLMSAIRKEIEILGQTSGPSDLEIQAIVKKYLDEIGYVFDPDNKETREIFLRTLLESISNVEQVKDKLNLIELALRQLHKIGEDNQIEIVRFRTQALLKPLDLPESNLGTGEIDPRMIESLRKTSCYDYKRSVEPSMDCDNLNPNNKLFGDFGRWFQREILDHVDNLWDRVGDEVKRAYNRVTDVIKYPRENFADFSLKLIKAPVEVYRKENFKLAGETIAGTFKVGGKIVDAVGDAFDTAGKPVINAINHLCERAKCPEIGLICDSDGNCVLTDSSGNRSEIILPDTMNWDEALQWMRQTELDDYLRDLQNNPSPHLENLFRNQQERQIFASLAQQSFDQLRERLENAQTAQEREALLVQINGQKELLDFLKGVGVGAFNNIKDVINAILGLPGTVAHAPEMLAMAARFYESTSFIEMFEMAEGALISKWEELQTTDGARRGEIIGYLGTDMLLAMLPAGAAGRFGSAAIREALQGSRLAGGVTELTESLVRFAPSKEGLQNFLSIVGNEFGGVGDFTEIARRIDGIKYPDVWTQGRFKDSVKNALKHYGDHGRDFSISSPIEYVERTYSFIRSPPNGTLRKVRANGDIILYHEATNTFAISTSDGVARTMYKPDPSVHGRASNLDYFNDQR